MEPSEGNVGAGFGATYVAPSGPDISALSAILDVPSGMTHGDPTVSAHYPVQTTDVHYGASLGHQPSLVCPVSVIDLDSQESGLKGVASRTLPVVLANFMRTSGKPALEEELYREVEKVYGELRKTDGARYTGNLERAIRGSLCSTGLFQKVGDGWALREEEARAYEQRLLARAVRQEEGRVTKRKQRPTEVGEPSDVNKKRKYTRKANCTPRSKRGTRRECIIEMLTRFSGNLRKEQNWQSCFLNPFKSFKGTESEDEVWKKLGNDRFIFMLQMFNYLGDIIASRHLASEAIPRDGMEGKGESLKTEGVPVPVEGAHELRHAINRLMEKLVDVESILTRSELTKP
mmetsp:Transcript_15190/g.30875  ORF Transcript_15190/g.30875 Transcript_15190/m.30875 type:complete len:346 (-) Transcript_15190:1183-2220(-)